MGKSTVGIPYFRWAEDARARICPVCGDRIAVKSTKSREIQRHWDKRHGAEKEAR